MHADNQLLHVMASMLPLSSSFSRENRWEAGVSDVLHTHLCKEDEDGNYVDDLETIAELDAADTALDGYDMDGKSVAGSSLRSEYEKADDIIGGPLLPTNSKGEVDWTEARTRQRQHKRWQRRLNRLNLSMREGKQQFKPEDLPTDARPDVNAALSAITENGNHAHVSVRVRIVTAYRIDRIRTHTSRCYVDVTTQCWVIDGKPVQE